MNTYTLTPMRCGPRHDAMLYGYWPGKTLRRFELNADRNAPVKSVTRRPRRLPTAPEFQ